MFFCSENEKLVAQHNNVPAPDNEGVIICNEFTSEMLKFKTGRSVFSLNF